MRVPIMYFLEPSAGVIAIWRRRAGTLFLESNRNDSLEDEMSGEASCGVASILKASDLETQHVKFLELNQVNREIDRVSRRKCVPGSVSNAVASLHI